MLRIFSIFWVDGVRFCSFDLRLGMTSLRPLVRSWFLEVMRWSWSTFYLEEILVWKVKSLVLMSLSVFSLLRW